MFASHRLGEVTHEQLQRAIDAFGLGTLESASPLPFGLFGQNLLLTTESGEYVLRGAPHYEWQLPTERYFAKFLHEKTAVPVPWPYHLSEESAPFDWPWGYALMPKMPGIPLADPGVRAALTVEQRLALARAQADLLIELQRVELPEPGSYDTGPGAIRPFSGGYVTRTTDRALANAQAARANGGHDGADHRWLESLLDSLRDLPEPDRSCVVHEDFNHNNMVAQIEGDTVTITGLFDLMTCHVGDGLADLARQFSMYLADPGIPEVTHAFVGSYLAQAPSFTAEDYARSVLYLIDERMLAWEYAHRPGHETLGWWNLSTPLRRWLESFLEQWEGIATPYMNR
jgi:aminoglycoside phosphotransferase (APT) family kinase protein